MEGGPTRVPPRERRSSPGPSFELLESKLWPPSARPGIVLRAALVDRLLAAHAVPVISVVAPPGYGKTMLLAQWAARAGPPPGWISVDRHDNDPAVLLTYIAVALDRIEPIDPNVFRALASPGAAVATTIIARFASAVSSMTKSVRLVIDNVELLRDQRCRDAVAELALHLPEGSQLAVASRDAPPLPLALLRDQGHVLGVGPDDLAMDEPEARALLKGAGVELPAADLTALIRRTEGWPVGLYLAALALKAGNPRTSGGSAFTGDDRLLADYLRSELLDRLSPSRVSFLTRTAVLDRMCGPMCDHVLGASGSRVLLASLERSNLLVIALDQRGKWYRYHHLFRDLLRAELGRREPDLVHDLHSRAAAWCEANDMPETAIEHAQSAGDALGVARLVGRLALPTYAAGQAETVHQWLTWFEDRGLIEQYPPIAVLGALEQALAGHAAGAERWADAAERASFQGTLPDGSTMEGWVAVLRALLCRDGVDRMRHDAESALAGLHHGSQLRATALLLEALSYLLEGEGHRADPILASAFDAATSAGAMPAASVSLAERSVVAIERHDFGEAETLAEHARTIVQTGHLEDYGPTALTYAVVARAALRRGDLQRAREHLARTAHLRPQLTYAIPTLAVQTLLELARAYLGLEDAAGARVVLREANDILQLRPALGVLPKHADQLRLELDAIRGATVAASSLTAAELRVLPLLPSHLSFSEIGDRLFVSGHTVKTQAMSIYRKLGVSSRSEAVQRAREIGVLVA
jgi:LuxR family maltose regulon positive regulatory protein